MVFMGVLLQKEVGNLLYSAKLMLKGIYIPVERKKKELRRKEKANETRTEHHKIQMATRT